MRTLCETSASGKGLVAVAVNERGSVLAEALKSKMYIGLRHAKKEKTKAKRAKLILLAIYEFRLES